MHRESGREKNECRNEIIFSWIIKQKWTIMFGSFRIVKKNRIKGTREMLVCTCKDKIDVVTVSEREESEERLN